MPRHLFMLGHFCGQGHALMSASPGTGGAFLGHPSDPSLARRQVLAHRQSALHLSSDIANLNCGERSENEKSNRYFSFKNLTIRAIKTEYINTIPHHGKLTCTADQLKLPNQFVSIITYLSPSRASQATVCPNG